MRCHYFGARRALLGEEEEEEEEGEERRGRREKRGERGEERDERREERGEEREERRRCVCAVRCSLLAARRWPLAARAPAR